MTVIHRLSPTIAVHTPLGHGCAIAWCDMGETINTIWKVRLEDGKCRNFFDDDILIYENPMNGEKPITIPEDWKPKKDNV